jgi:hypothetical protein
MLLEQLTAAWGTVSIACADGICAVSNAAGEVTYEAPTLLEALRMAVELGLL